MAIQKGSNSGETVWMQTVVSPTPATSYTRYLFRFREDGYSPGGELYDH